VLRSARRGLRAAEFFSDSHLAQSQDQRKPQAPSNHAPSSNSNLRLTLSRFTFSSHEALTVVNGVPQKHDLPTTPFPCIAGIRTGRLAMTGALFNIE
jgi:hypothetical protein